MPSDRWRREGLTYSIHGRSLVQTFEVGRCLWAMLPVVVQRVHAIAVLDPAGVRSSLHHRLSQSLGRLARERPHAGHHGRDVITHGGRCSNRALLVALLVVTDKGRPLVVASGLRRAGLLSWWQRLPELALALVAVCIDTQVGRARGSS